MMISRLLVVCLAFLFGDHSVFAADVFPPVVVPPFADPTPLSEPSWLDTLWGPQLLALGFGLLGGIILIALPAARSAMLSVRDSLREKYAAAFRSMDWVRQSIIWAVVIWVLMGIVPPWQHTIAPPGAAMTVKPAGYGVIIWPPAPECLSPICGVRIDLARLLVQWAVLAVVVGGVVLVNRRKT